MPEIDLHTGSVNTQAGAGKEIYLAGLLSTFWRREIAQNIFDGAFTHAVKIHQLIYT